MWNPEREIVPQEDDDSWEIKAFEEDTTNANGATWPPRSYTCTFCRREFKSAQALGGHMNVHRRDRARMHQVCPNSKCQPGVPPPALLLPAQDLVANAGLCFLYSLPNPNGLLSSPSDVNEFAELRSTFLRISPTCLSSFPGPVPCSGSSSMCRSTNTEASASASNDEIGDSNQNRKAQTAEELDLELRLGRSSYP